MGDGFLPVLQESFKQQQQQQQQHTVTDPNIGLFINHFPGDDHHPLTGFPLDKPPPLPQSPPNTATTPLYHHHQTLNNHKKRKSMETSNPALNSPADSSTQLSDNIGNVRKKAVGGRGKKAKGDEMEDEKLREVVHVRAKRGQATDSHSLAERVRREKINERLRCLQDIVPGCYKTMGMAVMLDEIINYVQSLQNQVEFLSMKLTAASTFYDFNSENDALEAMQRAKAFQAIKGLNGANHDLNPSQLASMCLNFGCSPQHR